MSFINTRCCILARSLMQKQRWLYAMAKLQHQPQKSRMTCFVDYSTNDHALADTDYHNLEIPSSTLNTRKTKDKYVSPQKGIADIINDRIAIIQQASHMSENDASQIATLFSPVFTLNQQAIQIISFLSRYNCDIKSILTQQPAVLGLDAEQCEANIDKVRETVTSQGFDPVKFESLVGELITKNPTILVLPTDSFMSIMLSSVSNYRIEADWILTEIANNTSQSILNHFPTAQTNHDDLKKIIKLFHDINILPHVVLSTAPAIFTLPYHRITKVYHKLISNPLYFQNDDIKKLFEEHGAIILKLDLDFIDGQCKRLSELISYRHDENLVYRMIISSPEYLLPETDTRPRVEFFTSVGFTRENISTLYTKLYRSKTMCRSVEGNLKPVVNCLLAYNDITIKQIMKSPKILSASYRRIKIRTEFLRAKNPQLLINEDLRLLIHCSNKIFTELCRFSDEEIAEYYSLFNYD